MIGTLTLLLAFLCGEPGPPAPQEVRKVKDSSGFFTVCDDPTCVMCGNGADFATAMTFGRNPGCNNQCLGDGCGCVKDQPCCKVNGACLTPLPKSPVPPRDIEFTLPRSYVAPTLWALKDAAGITWVHPDRDFLEQFVAKRNRARLVFYPVRATGCFGAHP